MAGSTAFVYGTLMAPEVLQIVIKRVPQMKRAVLKGFSRFRIKGAAYPAIVPVPGAEVHGKVLLDLNAEEMCVLDDYEDVEYQRETLRPILEDGSEAVAQVYIWKDEYKDLLETAAWDYDEFRAHHLADYLKRVEEFMAEVSGN